MSNVSTTNPVESSNTVNIAGSVVTAVGVAASVAAWLAKELVINPSSEASVREQRQSFSKIRGEASHSKIEKLSSLKLHSRDVESLLCSSSKLGFRKAISPEQPAGCILLTDDSGSRIVLEQTKGGTIQLHTVNGEAKLRRILHENTSSRAMEFLRSKDMIVDSKQLRNGELQLTARSKASVPATARAPQLAIQVKNDGSTVVDVSCIQGSACMDLTREFAIAVGSSVSQTAYKPEYEQPGEVRKTKVRV